MQKNNADIYEQRIKNHFRAAFNFLIEHKHARTHEDFTAISIALGKIGGKTPEPLLSALLVAAFEELEREYISEGENDK